MKWNSYANKEEIYASATNAYEKEILVLVEEFALEGPGVDLEHLIHLEPDQVAQALLLVVSHFSGGDLFFEQLSPIEKHLMAYQLYTVVTHNSNMAAEAGHTGEADESLLDGEPTIQS